MNLEKYRESKTEIERINDFFNLIDHGGNSALDIGSRDGYLSVRLAAYFDKVTALDLIVPEINNEAVECVAGDVCSLNYEDNSFNLVSCAEVLDHIPTHLLQTACDEIARVAKRQVIIGVLLDKISELDAQRVFLVAVLTRHGVMLMPLMRDNLGVFFQDLSCIRYRMWGKQSRQLLRFLLY